MLSKNIRFKNFSNKPKNLSVYRIFKDLKNNYLNNKIKILSTLSHKYKYNYSKKMLHKYKNFKNFTVVGIGGSILGTKAIYEFLNHKIKKNFFFFRQFRTKVRFTKKKSLLI